MSLLSVMVQIWGGRPLCAMCRRAASTRRPRSTSALVRIDVYDRPAVEVDDVEQFFVLVAAGFSQPRKQIHNALAQRLWFPPPVPRRCWRQPTSTRAAGHRRSACPTGNACTALAGRADRACRGRGG